MVSPSLLFARGAAGTGNRGTRVVGPLPPIGLTVTTVVGAGAAATVTVVGDGVTVARAAVVTGATAGVLATAAVV